MGLITPELSLDCRHTFVPRTIAEFLGEMSVIGDASERSSKIEDYVKRLEDEMRKIEAFKRELPFCMLLLNDAIVALKSDSVQCRGSKIEPVLEEFIPLKKNSDNVVDAKIEIRKDNYNREKLDWMNSVELWNSGNRCLGSDFTNHCSKTDLTMEVEEEENSSVTNDLIVSGKTRNTGKTSLPLIKGCSEAFPGLLLGTPGARHGREYMVIGGLSSKDRDNRAASSTASSTIWPQQQQQQISRKQRRCWSQELQKLFVNALEQLGGPHVATPKQIRELMQVEGLTNDEVKSHLQKYRFHIRRGAPTNTSSTANQSVVFGNLSTPQGHTKQSSSQSGLPKVPLGISLTGENNMAEEDDGKSGSKIPENLTLTKKNGV